MEESAQGVNGVYRFHLKAAVTVKGAQRSISSFIGHSKLIFFVYRPTFFGFASRARTSRIFEALLGVFGVFFRFGWLDL